MAGGLAVRGNLLCVGWSSSRGHVLLFDLDAGRRISAWQMPASGTGYSDAAGVAMDEHYHVYVADPHNDRVCHFSAFGRHLGNFGEAPPPVGDAARDRQGVMDRPHAVAVRGDQLYVAMGEQARRRGVQRWSRQGTALRPLGCRGDPEQKFGAPRGLWADAEGLLVADTLHGCLQQFASDARFVREWPCGSSRQARPIAVARQANGNLLFIDRGDQPGVFALDRHGRSLGREALQQHCDEPIALALDANQRVYVLDQGGERVLRFTEALQYEQVLFDLAEFEVDAPRAP